MRTWLFLAIAALTIAGCGGGSAPATGPASPAPEAPAVTPQAIAGEGYDASIPVGWMDRTHDELTFARVVRSSEGRGLLVLVHPLTATPRAGVDDVEGDIVVLRLDDAVPNGQLQRFATTAAGGSAEEGPVTTTLDTDPAVSVTYAQLIQGTPGKTAEMLVNHAGSTYDLSLTTSAVAFAAQDQDFAALLHSWHWTA